MRTVFALASGLLFIIFASPVFSQTSEQPACPANFDPDNPAWVMARLTALYEDFDSETDPDSRQSYLVTRGYGMTLRAFFYEPDAVYRLTKPRFSTECFGEVKSYRFDGREERAWTTFHAPAGTIHFLADENGVWHNGIDVVHKWDRSDPANPAKILLLFNGNNEPVATRRVPY